MRIEDYWVDSSIYVVAFIGNSGNVVEKILVVPDSIEKQDVPKIVFSRFGGVQEIRSIDEWGQALLLRENNNSTINQAV